MHVVGAVPSGLPHPRSAQGRLELDQSWRHCFRPPLRCSSSSWRRARRPPAPYATRYEESFSENTDLVGLALANIGAGLSGTFVVNGSPTKTQIVDSAGGRSQLSLLVTVAIVLLILLFLTGSLTYMPEAALSAIVFLIGVGLIDLAGMRKVFEQRRSEFWLALITALTVVIVGVEQGILLAIALSLIDHTRHGYRPKNAVLVPTNWAAGGRSQWPRPLRPSPGLVIYRFTHSLYYANAQQFSDEI